MTVCKWDPEAADYLADGEPCKVDDYGDPTKHCTARRTCSQHIGEGELTCARCVGRTRTDIRQIVERASLMLPEAMVTGVDSEAANLAGPAADPEAWSWRKIAAKAGTSWHLSLVEDDDDWHPYTVLARWAQMLTEDYDAARPDVWTITNAAEFLERILHRVAQDDGQDYPLLARELRRCRAHLESVLRDSLAPERGAPCPICSGAGLLVRLTREYPHWCTDEDCEQFHWDSDVKDRWVCPKDRTHVWDLESYSRWVEDRKAVGA